MTASYPSSVKTFTTKTDGTSIVSAVDVNGLQDEVTAIENQLGVNAASTALAGNTGAYAPAGTSSTVADRLKNLEAGLSASSSDGSRIGYTQLATGSVAASNSITVVGSSYVKLVVVINVTTQNGSGTQIVMTANSATSSKFGYMSFANPPVGGGNASGAGSIPISSAANPSSGDTITAEIYNCSGTGTKPVSFINGIGWGSGAYISGGTATAAITNITLTASTPPNAATYTVYGVK